MKLIRLRRAPQLALYKNGMNRRRVPARVRLWNRRRKPRPTTGKIVRWSKRRGWEIGLTPYQYHIAGLHLFQRLRFPRLMTRRRKRRVFQYVYTRWWPDRYPGSVW